MYEVESAVRFRAGGGRTSPGWNKNAGEIMARFEAADDRNETAGDPVMRRTRSGHRRRTVETPQELAG